METVIDVKNLVKIYPLSKGKTLEAVKGTSFQVNKGEIFGILGPNGAGKTTTLEIIEGLKPQTSGEIKVLGLDNLKETEKIKSRIGIQLQSSQYLHHLTLQELLELFASLYSQKSPVGADTIRPLQVVGLEDKKDEEFANLSGGQKQRFTIATSLVHQPEILFLDEPTTGLDPSARRDMWQLIKKLNSDGMTIVLTTHYMEEAEYLCHRAAIMDHGQFLVIDEPKKLIDKFSDTIQVSFFTEKPLDENIFKTLPEVKKTHAEFPKVVLEISSLDKISAIVNLLKQQNIVFYGFTVRTASLEDVYLDLTGREYEE